MSQYNKQTSVRFPLGNWLSSNCVSKDRHKWDSANQMKMILPLTKLLCAVFLFALVIMILMQCASQRLSGAIKTNNILSLSLFISFFWRTFNFNNNKIRLYISYTFSFVHLYTKFNVVQCTRAEVLWLILANVHSFFFSFYLTRFVYVQYKSDALKKKNVNRSAVHWLQSFIIWALF